MGNQNSQCQSDPMNWDECTEYEKRSILARSVTSIYHDNHVSRNVAITLGAILAVVLILGAILTIRRITNRRNGTKSVV